MRPFLYFAALPLGLCLSCAKVPAGSTGTGGKLLRVNFRVRGEIQPITAAVPYYYFVLIHRIDAPGDDPGPIPVIQPPWGNGFAAPAQTDKQGFVGFVRFGPFQPLDYGVYSCEKRGTDGAFALADPTTFGAFDFRYLGPPDNFTSPQFGESQLFFQVDLSRLPLSEKRYVQINILATDTLPQGVDPVRKLWDALGDGRQTGTINTNIILDTSQNIVRRNGDAFPPLEPPDTDTIDVREGVTGPLTNEPRLDIVDWTVEIRGS